LSPKNFTLKEQTNNTNGWSEDKDYLSAKRDKPKKARGKDRIGSNQLLLLATSKQPAK
jgi:hypothetical protein